MISRTTVDSIIAAARIDEVVSEFVTLKKRGANMIGLCPFHNEKTPSFTVSPAKGIYKCFGCGKAGNSVNFIMEHEHYTFPESLKYLAGKYNIEVEEDINTEEYKQQQSERESLFTVTTFAQQYFSQQLNDSDEGKALALSYLKERKFTPETIEKFLIGYSPESKSALSTEAKKLNMSLDLFEQAGLISNANSNPYDRFHSRVIFPIQNLTGRVIGFGGRILSNEKKTAKYINSPETSIYNKSKVLYGLFQAKKSIVRHDNCYLVEGYTDVIRFHQSGMENVVASSGTSLTVDQIKLIKRYTNNVTVLFDGDVAGIKASLRGIDMLLAEDLNIKVVAFAEGEDPDSFAQKVQPGELKEFLNENAVDFVAFKSSLLLEDAGDDPVKKSALIQDIVNSISKIPNSIKRALYLKNTAEKLNIAEETLQLELNKAIRKSVKVVRREQELDEVIKPLVDHSQPVEEASNAEKQEEEIIRLLLHYTYDEIELDDEHADTSVEKKKISVVDFLVHEILQDELEFENTTYNAIFKLFENAVQANQQLSQHEFTNHSQTHIQTTCIRLLSSQYSLSENWEKLEVVIPTEKSLLKQSVFGAVYHLKLKRVQLMIEENQSKMQQKVKADEDYTDELKLQRTLENIKSDLTKHSQIVVVK
ncbi:MAG: DNA primase [Bacteroidia bacterium]|nr:DNA primase [Bacteroidia bacterium]NNM15309.1 DNA primase [Bacteroidia bacterium]